MQLLNTFVSIQKRLHAVAMGIVGKEHAEDIVQESFVKSLEALQGKPIRYEKTYLFQTVKNLSLNHVSKHSEAKDHSSDGLEGLTEKSVPLEKQCEDIDSLTYFCEVLEGLTPAVKKVFWMKRVMGYTQKEIAVELGISEKTVEKHVAKGLLHCASALSAKDVQRGSVTPLGTSNTTKLASGKAMS